MRLLVLGGTWFLGRAIVEHAVGAGHEVTVFNRGRSGPPPSGAHVVHGDRTNRADLAHLATGAPWDAVIDVPGVIPAQVRAAARALREAVGRYVFVSTVSVYRDWPDQPVTEASPLHDGDPDADPGAWWLHRLVRGGEVLAPGLPGAPVRPVDVGDLASFIVHLVGTGHSGAFNIAGPAGRDTFGGFLDAVRQVTGGSGTPVWVDSDWLVQQGVRQWTELPMWRTAPGTWAIDATRAETAGLTCRPLLDTVTGTWAWIQSGGGPIADERRALHGLDPEREAALLAQWRLTGQAVTPGAEEQ